jgi:acyl-CoA synthetase (NDP forming)
MTASKSRTRSATPSGTEAGTSAGTTVGTERTDRVANLLEARSVAVVGASDRPGPARNVVSNLGRAGFAGPVYLINAKRASVAGMPAYPSLAALPVTCDLVVAAVNREATVEVVEQAAKLGTRAAVLLAAGFAESGRRGALLETRLAEASHDIALLGPNCLGFANLEDRLAPYSGPLMDPPEAGPVALVSNSGAIACTLTGAAAERGLRFGYVVTTGNQVDLRTANFVRYLADRPSLKVIACYIEGFADGRELLEAFRAAAEAGKRLVVLKAGRTKTGGEAARTHTGALAGSSALQESLFGQVGVMVARDLEEFLAVVELGARLGPVRSGHLGIVTISGGERLLMADATEEAGLTLANLSEETEARLKSVLPAFAAVSNPLDTTGAGIVDGDVRAHAEAVAVLAADPDVGLVVACQDAKNGWAQPQASSQMFLDAVTAAHLASAGAGKPLAVVSPTCGTVDARARRYMVDNGIPFLAGLGPAMSALAKILGPPEVPGPVAGRGADGRRPTPLEGSGDVGRGRLDARQSFARLQAAGAEVWPHMVVQSEPDVVAGARLLGWPVALKLAAATPHRGEVDGVRLNLADERAVKTARQALVLAATAAGISDHRLLVQPMAPDGVEIFVGGLRDPQFGPVVLVGPGGSGVEDLGSFVAALAPVSRDRALELVARALSGPGPHGKKRREFDHGAVATTIAAISRLVAEPDVAAVDVNPGVAMGKTIAVVDAKVVLT